MEKRRHGNGYKTPVITKNWKSLYVRLYLVTQVKIIINVSTLQNNKQ
jgi:hypothetical protein